MPDLQTATARAVDDFVAQITEIAKRAAVDALGSATPSRAGRGGHGVKRSPAQLEKTAATVRAFIAKHPGLRIEQINKSLKLTTVELALPIRKLIASGEIKTKGEKRATTYFPLIARAARRSRSRDAGSGDTRISE